METKSSLTLARRMFARALELDPRFARAYASTATCDLRLYSWHGVKFSVADILDLTGKALEIESDLAEALAARGYALMIAGRRIEAASAFERALVFNPESFDAHYSYGKYWVTVGEFERNPPLRASSWPIMATQRTNRRG
jgi:adenylate cyclase